MTSRAYRNNNPGNLRYGEFAERYRAKGPDPDGFAVFPHVRDGMAAMTALVAGPSYENLTLREALHKYAPKSENDTDAYLKYVSGESRTSPDQTLGLLPPARLFELIAAMCRFEGWIA